MQTTGHVWDGDLQEFNNPLPAWWLWAFYATIIFSVVYWVVYPAWPLGKGFTTGVATITYENDKGVEKTTHWNTRALLMKDLQEAREYAEALLRQGRGDALRADCQGSGVDQLRGLRRQGRCSPTTARPVTRAAARARWRLPPT